MVVPGWMGFEFEPFAWLALLPIIAIPLSIVAGIREYRLWDLEPISRDALSATLVVLTGGFIFALTNHLLLRYAGGLGSLRNLFAFATGVLLVVLLQPVRLRVEKFLDQWFHHGRIPECCRRCRRQRRYHASRGPEHASRVDSHHR